MLELNNILGKIKGSKKFSPVRGETTEYSIVIPELNGLGVMTLNLLLYRLNNINQRVVIYLQDNKAVNKVDVASGLYTMDDIGRKRAEVVRDKYAGSFDNVRLIDVIKGTAFLRSTLGNRNLFFIDTSKNGEKEDYEILFRNQSFDKFKRNNAYIRYEQIDGESDVVKLDLRSVGLVVSKENYPIQNSKITKKDRYIKNTIASVTIASIVNNLVTEGMDINFSAVQFGVKEGTQKEYIE